MPTYQVKNIQTTEELEVTSDYFIFKSDHNELIFINRVNEKDKDGYLVKSNETVAAFPADRFYATKLK